MVIWGAGASIASTNRDLEVHSLKLPSMNNLPDVVGLGGILRQFPQEFICDNFEATYSNIAERDPDNPLLKVMNDMIYAYFQSMIESINARKYIVGFDILKILMAVVGI